ncbi:MAG: P-loop NTPase family protein [Candidatus Krumholzibacteriia bacterium]
MSKIYEAYRKRVGDEPDLAVELGRLGTVGLYPPPEGKQKDEFNQLANRLLGLKPDIRGTVLGFASTAAGEGASFVSFNAAMCLATIYKRRVAWIDANFQSPQKQLLYHDGPTLSTLLQHPERLENLSLSANPVLIPAGSDLEAVRGLFADQKCHELVRALSRLFEFTLIDLPPVSTSTDTALMAAATDGLTLVVEQRFLKREVILHGIESLRAKSVRVLGTVINRRSYDLPKVIYDRL